MQFDVTFPVIPCSLLSLDAVDISGEQHLDIVCIATSKVFCAIFSGYIAKLLVILDGSTICSIVFCRLLP